MTDGEKLLCCLSMESLIRIRESLQDALDATQEALEKFNNALLRQAKD